MTNGSGASYAQDSFRYSKANLYSLFKDLQESEDLDTNIDDCFVQGWEPGAASASNGAVGQSPWTRREEAKETQYSLDTAWDPTGSSLPLGLVEMSEDERQV